jgi:hypothetical protein
MVVAPLTFSQTPVNVRLPPPMLDQHREEIQALARAASPSPGP